MLKVALDRDRGQCIPDRSVAGFPSAHTDNDAQRVRKIGSAMIMGNAITECTIPPWQRSASQPTNRWNSRRWTTAGVGIGIGHLMALIASLSISASVPRPQEQRQFVKSASALVQNASNIIAVVAADGTVSCHKFVRQTDFKL